MLLQNALSAVMYGKLLNYNTNMSQIFTARRVCTAQYVVARCPSVRPSVSKRLHISSKFFTIGQRHHSSFPIPNGMAIFRREPLNGGIECKGCMKKIMTFDHYFALSRKWCKIEP